MSLRPHLHRLSIDDVELILTVTSKLAAPFDLMTMLAEVVEAAKNVLRAERGSVWLYDAATDEMVLRIATGIAPVRVPAGAGLIGACAREGRILNVPDCYADERFNPEVDRASGYRTRCMLTLPLVDHKDVLVGAMQVLNKIDGVFDDNDESLATVLAAQCAVAIQRTRMTEAVIEGEKLRNELETARLVQMSTLPAAMPVAAGYDFHGMSRPADQTGGDTFDLAVIGQDVLVVLADATGHGIAPALSVTQMQAMLRIAFRLGADLETAFLAVNNQLAETMADDRFITAFVGLLETARHRVRFHSGGQAPILHFRAEAGSCTRSNPTSFPLAAMPLKSLRPAPVLDLAPGDVLALLSDGIFEYRNAAGEEFGEQRVEQAIAEHRGLPMAALASHLLTTVGEFARGAKQEDDITIVLVKREAAAHESFARTFDSLPALAAFTSAFFARHGVSRVHLNTLDLALEELFTNMVKYSPGGAQRVDVDIATLAGGIEVVLTDYDVDFFDVTRAPDANVELPIEQRRPGGLGLHLIRRMLDSLEYQYSEAQRMSQIRFRKNAAESPASGGSTPQEAPDARH
jgi:sigma-B regulation protein RsbU (phosphoserine phosphatase)